MWLMPYFAKVCHIIRIDVKSKDFGTALAMWESWHRYAHRPACINKSIKPTTPASHSPKQVIFIASVLSLPHKCFFIVWVNLVPEQSRWSRLGHKVSNGAASIPNASQVNLAHVLAYIVEGLLGVRKCVLLFMPSRNGELCASASFTRKKCVLNAHSIY